MFLKVFLTLVFVISCSTKPTPYQREKKKEGYHDATYEDLRVATFKANTKTKITKAKNYAEFRAIEYCIENENQHANIIDINDKTVRKEITRTSGSGWGPTYGFGMYPYYSRYSSFGIGASFNSISSDSWNETLTFPFVQVFYTCTDKVVRPELILKEISQEQMKLLVKDLKGALQVERVAEYSPNKGVVEAGDLILKAEGKRIERVYELIRLFKTEGSVISVLLLREGERVMAKLKGKDITADALKMEKEIISRVCKDKKKKNQKLLKEKKLCQSRS
jgi:hypothetical protein